MAYNAGATLVRVVMTATSGLPADQVVNDFVIDKQGGGAPNGGDITAWGGALDAFYNTAHTGAALGSYLSAWIDRDATHRMDYYHIVAGPLGSPFTSQDWIGPTPPVDAHGLPQEAALALSFHADLTTVAEEVGATRPRARRRGRVFLGPLHPTAMDYTTPPYMVADAIVLAANEAMVALLADLAGASGDWSVWSRAGGELNTIAGGWTDNALDTQRRRGPAATGRTTW